MDKLVSEMKNDAIWGSDPYFPHWNLGDREERVMTVISPPNRPTKPATVPYSGGSKPEPKLEWKVELNGDSYKVFLIVNGRGWAWAIADHCYGWLASKEKRVKRAKADLLFDYNLCKKESGRVENS